MESLFARCNPKKIRATLGITNTELLSKYQERTVCLHKVPNLISLIENNQTVVIVAWCVMKNNYVVFISYPQQLEIGAF